MPDNYNKNRIIKNSAFLYVRMLFTMWLNLWTTRLVLANLGVEDMGIYGVVGSIVSLLNVFTNGITNAVQRFITYEEGKKNGNNNLVFCSSLNIIFILVFLILIILEIGGIYMLYYSLKIPEKSIDTAFWVLQLSILTCIVNIISIPYNALIIAHEKMNAFAFISILQVVLNFIVAYSLTLFSNRLLMYAIFMAFISIIIRLIYQLYCHIKFQEAKFHFVIDKNILKQIGKFTGISTISGILQVSSTQGIVFVINWTFGIAINAVYNIAYQVKLSILSFSLNLFKAISPQITKTFANNEIESCKKLVYSGSKMEVYMIYFIMIPFLCKADYIIHLWLGEVPSFAVEFSMSMVFLSLTYALFEPIRTLVLATNKIFKFMIIPDTFYLMVLPISYIISKITNAPLYLILTIVGMDILSCIIRIYYATKVSPIAINELMKSVVLPSICVGIIDGLICYGLTMILPTTLSGLIILLLANSFVLCLIIYFVGINTAERQICYSILKKIRTRHN